MKYKASMDKNAIGITTGVLLLFIFIVFNFIFYDSFYKTPALLFIISFAIILLLAYIYAPNSYTLTKKLLIINRPVGNISIELSDIDNIELFINRNLSIRSVGIYGLFGFYGRYYNRVIGSMDLYATRLSNRLLITTKSNRRLIISPDDIFLYDDLNNALMKD